MIDKEKTIKELKEALDSLDITNKYRLNIIRAIEYLQEESISEDLEEAAKEYSFIDGADDIEKYARYDIKKYNSFKAGAKWQKEQNQSTTEDLGKYINELSKQFPEVSFAKLSRIAVRVAKWQKEQMMKNAISLKVKETFGKGDEVAWVIRPSKILDKKFNVGEKVKVIVIKEG